MLTAPELKLIASRAGHEPIPNIHIMEDHDGAYDVWKTERMQGRILVHFDGHLDFNWIADRSPEELLTAGSSEELDRRLAEVADWNLGGKPLRRLVHIGNFVYPAIKERIVREFFWVIPDPFWATRAERQMIRQRLEEMVRRRPADAGPITVSETGMTSTLLGCPFTVCPLENLPTFSEAVLLDVDVDYLITRKFTGVMPYYERQPVAPWIWPSGFLQRLKAAQLPTDLVTIAYSVEGGYTPLRYKYFGDLLRESLCDPYQPVSDEPPTGSAAEAFEEATQALKQNDVRVAREWWTKMVSWNPSYRTVYATPGWREETKGRWRSALEIYKQMIQIDPSWHVPHLGNGRVLWRLRRWDQAEEAFETASRLTSGPTSAFYWRGRCASRRGDWDTAQQQWRTAVHRDPEDGSSWYFLARLEAKGGNHADALAHARRCVELGMDGPAVHWLLARAAWHLGQRRLCRRELGLWARRLLQTMWAQGLAWWRQIRSRRRRDVYGTSEVHPQGDA